MTFLVAASNSSALNDVEPGLLGFLVVAALGVALVFLLRSMNKQFRKIGPPPEETDADELGDAASQRPLRGLAAHRAAMQGSRGRCPVRRRATRRRARLGGLPRLSVKPPGAPIPSRRGAWPPAVPTSRAG